MKYKGYLIDLDGTVYNGSERIDAAVRFVKELHRYAIPYLFVTNNSAKTPENIAEKLMNMDIPATPKHVFTSGMALATYIHAKKENARCYMIGDKGLQKALEQKNIIPTDIGCDFVILGKDQHITYEKYAKACLAVRDGATFLSTNGDMSVPTERGLLPGNGALASVITASTGVKPVVIGKPERTMMDEALKTLGTSKEETLMIGDNYDTDIQAGIKAGIDTLMVLTGVTQHNDLEGLTEKPTYTANDLDEWLGEIQLGDV